MKQIAREIIKMKDKKLDKRLAKKMISPYDFIDRGLQLGFSINLESHNSSHANSIWTFTPNFPEFGIEIRYIIKIMKKLSVNYARLVNQYKLKNHTLFSASFYKNKEEDQRSDETDLFINLKIIHNLKETDIKNIDVKSQLEHQIQIQGTKESVWMFDKINSMKMRCYETGETNSSNYVKIPLRSSASKKIKNIDNYCSLWSILAGLHPSKNDHPNRVSKYRQ